MSPSENQLTDEELLRAIKGARATLAATGYVNPVAQEALHGAQRALAAARGEQWAEAIDIGARWDGGAPLPHLISNGSTAIVICHASVPDPAWDGTQTRVVSPSDRNTDTFLKLTLLRCHSIKFGGPNDEVIHAHPLYDRGLEPYSTHVVHNSMWLTAESTINSVHPFHSTERFRRLNHYLLGFHDETLEALAESLDVEEIEGVLGDLLIAAANSLVRV